MFKRFTKFSTKSIKDFSELTNQSLILLHIIFRHGNRTPSNLKGYPTDPWSEMEYRPYGPAQLTNKGKQLIYDLGCLIRKMYDSFLGEYRPGILEARTTPWDRTQCSMQLFLAGLYPPSGALIWEPTLLWQPIPYTWDASENDKVLQAFTHDRQYKLAYFQFQKNIEVKQKFSRLFAYIEYYSQKKMVTLQDVWRMYFKLLMQKEMGLELPAWTKNIFPSPMEELASLNYVLTCATPELRRCVLKHLTNKIVTDTNLKISEANKTLLHLYSGHEMNIAHTLIALNSFAPPHIPQYGSCVILEIHKVDNVIYVKGLYRRKPTYDFEPLRLWNQNPVNFQDFVVHLSQQYE